MNKKGQIIKALPIGNNCVVPKKFKNKETIVEFKKGEIFFIVIFFIIQKKIFQKN